MGTPRFKVGDRVRMPHYSTLRYGTVIQVDTWNPKSTRPRPRILVQPDEGAGPFQYSPKDLRRTSVPQHDHNDQVRRFGSCSICLAAPRVEAERKRQDPTHVVDTRHVAQVGNAGCSLPTHYSCDHGCPPGVEDHTSCTNPSCSAPDQPARQQYLVTIQAYVDTDSAVTAENIAIEACRYLEEANEDPAAYPTTIQTCIAHKAPFRPLGADLWAGASCEDEIAAAT